MRIGPVQTSVPTLVAIGFALVVAVVIVVAASTSATAFGPHNPGWQGLSEVRDEADAAGVDAVVVTDSNEYDAVSPQGTVLLVVAPAETTEAERARLRTFVEAGGTVVVAAEEPAVGNDLLSRLGTSLRVDGDPLLDERHHDPSPAFPLVTSVADDSYAGRSEGMALNHGTAVTIVDGSGAPDGPASSDAGVAALPTTDAAWDADDGPTAVANTSAFAYVDRDGDGALSDGEHLAPRAAIATESVGNGEVVVVGDPSTFINVMMQRDANRAFVADLLSDHDRVALDRSDHGVPPLVGALLSIRRTTVAGVLAGLLLIGAPLAYERRVHARLWALRRLVGGRRQSPAMELQPDPDALQEYLSRRYPEMEPDQRERVLAGIMGVGPEGHEHARDE